MFVSGVGGSNLSQQLITTSYQQEHPFSCTNQQNQKITFNYKFSNCFSVCNIEKEIAGVFASIFIQIWHSIPDPIWIFLKWKLFGRRFYCPDANPLLLVPVTGLKNILDFTINLETILSKLPADSEVIVLGDMNMCALRKDNV